MNFKISRKTTKKNNKKNVHICDCPKNNRYVHLLVDLVKSSILNAFRRSKIIYEIFRKFQILKFEIEFRYEIF